METWTPNDWVTVIGALSAFATAIGVAIKSSRDTRRERGARRRELETVARAAAKGPEAVQAANEDLESTGAFQRPTLPRDDG